MKKLFLFFLIFFIRLHANAQTGIFFQAIARDINTNPAKDRKIYVQSNIIQSSPTGTIVLIEDYQTYTDAFGIFNILVGSGNRVGGTVTGLSTIDWSKGPYYLNLKIVITPVGVGAGWDHTKEWVDIGTTIFGTVPFALYSANTAKIDDKLNATDTTKMLEPYAKGKAIQVLSTTVDTKLATKDTAAMLAPYAKLSYNLDSNFLKKQIASLLGPSDTIKYTKQIFTDSALLKKMNVFDTSIYAKQAFVDAVNYNQQKFVETSLLSKFNLADTIKYTKKTFTDSALLTKLSITGNAATATLAGNISATSNTTLSSLPNLNTVGTITNGVWSATTIDIAHGGTGLNTSGTSGQALTATAAGTLTWTNVSTLIGAHYLGESFGGGIVFYVYDNGKHGLILSPEDQSTGINASTYISTTCCSTTNAFRDGVNAGMLNTERIILNQGSGNYAAILAANYKGGGFGDWYLPSIAEIKLIILNSQYIMSTFINPLDQYKIYWSSNENPSSNKQYWANYFIVDNGNYLAKYGNPSVRVRAIRSF